MVDEDYVPIPGEHVTMLGYTNSKHPKRIDKDDERFLRQVNSTVANLEECQKLYRDKYGNSIVDFERHFCVNLRNGKVHCTNQGEKTSQLNVITY